MNLLQQITHHYEEQALPPERLREMTALVRGGGRTRRRLSAPVGVALAAAAGLLVAVVILLGRGEDRTRSVAREVALNHTKQLAPDTRAETYAALGRQMTKLDFALVAPAANSARGLRVEGARYCSLAGCIAAQVRLRDAGGRALTLYAVRDQMVFDAVESSEVVVDDVRIRLWREGDLVFALAESRHP